jgi:hypothetical protein
LREFVAEVEGKTVNKTNTNFTGLEQLCEEFGADEFAGKLSDFGPLMDFKEAEDADAC